MSALSRKVKGSRPGARHWEDTSAGSSDPGWAGPGRTPLLNQRHLFLLSSGPLFPSDHCTRPQMAAVVPGITLSLKDGAGVAGGEEIFFWKTSQAPWESLGQSVTKMTMFQMAPLPVTPWNWDKGVCLPSYQFRAPYLKTLPIYWWLMRATQPGRELLRAHLPPPLSLSWFSLQPISAAHRLIYHT